MAPFGPAGNVSDFRVDRAKKSIYLAMSETVCAECGGPADLKCSACKLVAYCGKEHQKKHWKVHKGLCRPFEVSRGAVLRGLRLLGLRIM